MQVQMLTTNKLGKLSKVIGMTAMQPTQLQANYNKEEYEEEDKANNTTIMNIQRRTQEGTQGQEWETKE